ncbi:MAG: prepilin-type N-terminal cleavage/methylation domain-containing protein [Anaerolineales bacterium]
MKKNQGQSLIEMLVAIAIVLVVIVALVAVTTVSIRNASFSRNQALATKYAQEGIEEARKLRDERGDSFFVANPADCNISDTPATGFSRQRTCSFDGNKTMTITVVVSWTDAQGIHKSELTTRLTNWK